MEVRIDQQCHGYRSGHQLLAGSIKLPRLDQDLIDRLSDVSGPLRPNDIFSPYLTAYPLPSGKFYIFARTWQDLEAPRAGCVLTRSLVLPMHTWETLDNLSSLINLLKPVDRTSSETPAAILSPSNDILPSVKTPRTAELVEALFFESRRPIVMFDEPEAELIAERLLTAFWPGMRRDFSICTLALAPRSIGGRAFDLLFAPKNARVRFSDWIDRRIESAPDVVSPSERHRWTASTVHHIFRSAQPSLITLDALGVLRDDERGDESILRLSLLWNELVERSETSPTAILGLLDIVNSQGRISERASKQLRPLIGRAIDLVVSSLPQEEAFEFMVVLHGKFSSRKPPMGVPRMVLKASAALAYAAPDRAFVFLRGKDNIEPVVLAGIGNGLARATQPEYALRGLTELSAEAVLRLLAFSRLFAERLTRLITAEPSAEWSRLVAEALEYPDAELRARARRFIVSKLDHPAQASLLGPLLLGADTLTLVSVVHHIWATTRFGIEAFDQPLYRAARGEQGMAGLRAAILAPDETDSSNRFLLSTLRSDVASAKWLCNEASISERRRTHLLITLFANADDRELESLAQYSQLSARLEDALLTSLPDSAMTLARLLILGSPSVERLLPIGLQIFPHITGEVRTELGMSLLSGGLSAAPRSHDDLVSKTLEAIGNEVDPHQLIILATPPHCAADRISSNIKLLNRTAKKLRDAVLARIDELTHRIAQRIGGRLDAEAVVSLASMLVDAGKVNADAQLRAASTALSYSLKSLQSPVSPLIVAAFPVVYKELKSEKETPRLLSFFFFPDWDRCKIARRDIVSAFMNSSWPPADLLLAVLDTGDAQEILQRVLRERDGEAYLSRVEKDLDRLPKERRARIEKELKTLRRI
jgi:GTPase-associated protein 1, N-terminal domain type 1